MPNNTERRFSTAGTIFIRPASGTASTGRTVRGYAAVFNKRSDNFGTSSAPQFEVIAQGAFDNVLNDDVRALLNHDPSLVLARSKGGVGTLKLGTDSIGLWYEFDAPETSAGNDLLVSLKRGDITQSSFSFIVSSDAWTNEGNARIRTIRKLRSLLDVSPVTYPAYPDATVSARSSTHFSSLTPPTPPRLLTRSELRQAEVLAARFQPTTTTTILIPR